MHCVLWHAYSYGYRNTWRRYAGRRQSMRVQPLKVFVIAMISAVLWQHGAGKGPGRRIDPMPL